jgi:hypothetical protein
LGEMSLWCGLPPGEIGRRTEAGERGAPVRTDGMGGTRIAVGWAREHSWRKRIRVSNG